MEAGPPLAPPLPQGEVWLGLIGGAVGEIVEAAAVFSDTVKERIAWVMVHGEVVAVQRTPEAEVGRPSAF